ncbi:MAG TPA: glutamine-hydrolyzing carbamoyl-phosphate synthase small subunit [Candidatus Paceibacterota bacterium]|nr:glutamine-hydrolyzing carbamoyl-phosphate synthase small subunit [Candidatus Paceibacterota bacterium]
MKLLLKDGTAYEGESFGAEKNIAGEVVFATGMTGYVEAFTDPSFAGQILVLTYPLIGNYGVPAKKTWESEKMQIAGLVVANYSENYSHHDATESLGEWCKASGVPAITGVDTRAITKKLREKGAMLGQLVHSGKPGVFVDPNEENLVAMVSPKQKKVYGKGSIRIVLVDCGAKENIVRSLVRPETTLIRVPWDYDFSKENYRALAISNGPGDPTMCSPAVENIKKAMKAGKPIVGVCLGNQLLALAAGAKTYKLPFGHRGQNVPCTDEETGRCYITSQNHGYSIDAKTLPKDWKVWFTNANDGSVEGIAHKTKPWRSVQFHPEASPGPTDSAWIFERFIEDLKNNVI